MVLSRLCDDGVVSTRVDPFAPASLEDPYALYGELRRDAPVYQIPETGIWLVSRHDDVVQACARPDIFSSHISAVVYAGQGGNPVVLAGDPEAIGAVDVLATQDPPAHTAQRKLMNRTFVHARIAALEPVMRAFVNDALTHALAQGRIEWMSAVANPLPLMVIAAMLGLADEDKDDVHRWADAGVDLLSGVAPPERMAHAWELMIGFLAYLRARIADPAPGSVTAEIAAAHARAELSESEAASLMLQLVIAGSESTASLLGSAARLLANDPALQRSLREDPARIPVFLEEALRLESPFRGHFRVTTHDTTLGGVAIPAGARVMLLWGAGNRDPVAFADADRLDTARPQPKSHLAFGSGIHFCLGAPLARLEARIAIEALLARTSSFLLAEPAPHVPSLFVRRPASVTLTLHANADASTLR
jgi:cytochrome P450